MHKRAYSRAFTPRGKPARYLLDGIPPGLWKAARAKAKCKGYSMRHVLLALLTLWVKEKGQPD